MTLERIRKLSQFVHVSFYVSTFMRCNGKNHRPNCQCSFGTGFACDGLPNDRPLFDKNTSRPPVICKSCKQSIYLRRSSQGRWVPTDNNSFPWKSHFCIGKTYKCIGRNGKPKLRNRKEKFDRGGWGFLIIEKIERNGSETIITGIHTRMMRQFKAKGVVALNINEKEVSYGRFIRDNEIEIDCRGIGLNRSFNLIMPII